MSPDSFGRTPLLRRLYHLIQHQLGLTELRQRIEKLETEIVELQGREVGKARWMNVNPDTDLTCGRLLTGHGFVTKVEAHGGWGPCKTILEVGPGYGRILQSALEFKVQFGVYVGVDISPKNIEFLKSKFRNDSRFRFKNADAETVIVEPFDTMISSMTMKHFHPTFERALDNLVRQAHPGARFIFDLVEHEGFEPKQYFEAGAKTFLRRYSREEVKEMIERVRLRLLTFDTVDHGKGLKRLLVVAETT